MNMPRSGGLALAAILITAGLQAAPATQAQAAAWCSAATGQDFDDDGHADLVVARTLPTSRSGVVDLVMSGGTTQTISAATLGFTATANDQFGAAVHIASVDESDNCPDLVIGAPGASGGGAVFIVRGTGAGVATDAVRLTSGHPGARFGATVATVGLSFTRMHLLAGAPGLDLGSATDAGALLAWRLEDGAPIGAPAIFDYSDFGAAPASGDRLGSVLDVADWRITLGVPGRNIGAASDAGEVITFSLVDEPGVLAVAQSTRANQNSPGAPGVPESGDQFGAAVDAGGAYVLVGVPGEDLSGRTDAGMVMRFVDNAPSASGWVAWHQDTSGVPGVSEAGDRFGAAVSVAWVEVLEDGDPVGREVLVIGAPTEDIGSVRDAGAITVLAWGVRPAFGLSQGSGLPGKAERGDLVGAALGDLPGEYDGPYYGGDGLVVGAPGEDVGDVRDSGLVMWTRGLLPKGTFGWSSARNLGTIVAGARYGWSLPAAR